MDYLNQGSTGSAHPVLPETMSWAGSSAKASVPKPLAKMVSLHTQAPMGPGSVASEVSSRPTEQSGLMTVTPRGSLPTPPVARPSGELSANAGVQKPQRSRPSATPRRRPSTSGTIWTSTGRASLPPTKGGSKARPTGATNYGSYRLASVAGSIQLKVAEYPFLLSVHVGKTKHQALLETVWDKITAKLSKCILDLIRRPDHIWLKMDYLAYANGSGKIACLNEGMAEWYRNAIASLDIEGVGFQAWANVEAGELCPARMVGMGLEDFSSREIIKVILAITDPPLTG
jgi:hypothetical protein